jgi:hypothetical protein
MQERELNCATIGVANRTDISGRATADEINRGLRTGKARKRLRKACLTYLWTLTVAGLFVAVAPLPARADNEEDARHGREDNDKGIRAEITALQATVSALQRQVNTLQTHLAAVQSNHALALGPFVSVDLNPEIGVKGPNITFTGANIHIASGSGSTDDNGAPRGLGNLIIGYDEDPQSYVDTSPFDNLPLSPLIAGDRGGSHNLVIGAANRFTQAAKSGLVVGTANTIESYGASVTGGAGNTASLYGSSVSGGFSNTADGFFASVSGGRFNTASGPYCSVSGGDSNVAGGSHCPTCSFAASVSGGAGNFASGNDSSVTGGSGNKAFDLFTSITGGTGNTAGSFVTFQGGLGSTITGGSGNSTGGRYTVVIGGQNVTDNRDVSIAPQPPFP